MMLLSAGGASASNESKPSMEGFVEINPRELEDNYTRMLSQDWALVSAGTESHFNTMTISWGAMGHLWQRPVAMVYIRPKRYTHQFIEREDRMTITFFGGRHKADMKYLGTNSGRDGDKLSKTTLKTMFTPSGLPTFEQAEVIIEGKKLYKSRIDPENFMDQEFQKRTYKLGEPDDYHDVYVLLIERVWKRVD